MFAYRTIVELNDALDFPQQQNHQQHMLLVQVSTGVCLLPLTFPFYLQSFWSANYMPLIGSSEKQDINT